MPKSWWGKIILWTYIAGYYLQIVVLGLWSWSLIPSFWLWQSMMAQQLYLALLWPLSAIRLLYSLLAGG